MKKERNSNGGELKSKSVKVHPDTHKQSRKPRQARKNKLTATGDRNWLYGVLAAVVTCVIIVVIFFFGGRLWRFGGGLFSNGNFGGTPDWLNDSIYSECPDGIDMSHHQNDIEWEVLGAHPTVKFIYLKATEGATHHDRHYMKHYANARRVGLQIGSYHYYQPRVPVMDQVDNFVRHTDFELDNLRPVIDIEVHKGMKKKALQDSLRLCLDTLTAIIGDKPIIYTSRNFYHEVLDDRFGDYPLWIADYRHGESLPTNCVLWQYSESGKVVGVRHDVDCNKLIKTLSDIQL